MKLYLSSYKFGDNPQVLADLIGENKKIAIIPNALDVYADISRRAIGIQDEKDGLLQMGLDPEELDLRDYFGKQEELRKKINNYGAGWVLGGNTFILRRAMAQSGFDKILKEKRNDNSFVYAGYSAGVCVITPTLHGLEIVDDPNVVPEGYSPKTIWDGLGFVDYSIAPHYKSNHPESTMVDATVKYFIENKMPHKTLRDGEVIIEEL